MTRRNRRVWEKDQTLTWLGEAQTMPTRITFRRVCYDDGVVRSAAPRHTPGRFSDLTFSPNGRFLLIGWPDADQWLFVPLRGGNVKAVGRISQQFAPGAGARMEFPALGGWCCAG